MISHLSDPYRKFLFFVLFGCCLLPVVTPPVALCTGFLLTHFFGNPFARYTHSWSQSLLKLSVVGLGLGVNVSSVIENAHEGLGLTLFSIILTLVLGLVLGTALHLTRKTSHLVASGTAICGGSAIAAIAPVVNASEREVSVALGTVFLLNAVALVLFPIVGHTLHMSQHQFGLWAAIAIHDTSSVVGAASNFGTEALQVATTVKLARALWIIPVALISSLVFHNKEKKITIPWFIGGFIAMMLLNSYLSQIHPYSHTITSTAKAGLTAALFLIGAGISLQDMKQIGWKPLTLGIILWLVISVISLWVILNGG
ncbi:putative sulfate exporter family transporter [Cytophagaceae bacterium YF14B1]|uniref:Sulfate exporter family transporter n=1 Tax=Xanthocytophaga flava TaxID=3048013 RepID=A0AAE3QLA2_9BACT|nr:putative sulfate exporter family transporter [Xanthocytophaga flavus]MDJ1479503.1 putative sulfate exporter family transporter [Xanthocytophaga flavus]